MSIGHFEETFIGHYSKISDKYASENRLYLRVVYLPAHAINSISQSINFGALFKDGIGDRSVCIFSAHKNWWATPAVILSQHFISQQLYSGEKF